jgi:hypothetical protein
MQGEHGRVLEDWVASIRMREMHEDCQMCTSLKGRDSEKQRQRTERKIAQVHLQLCSILLHHEQPRRGEAILCMPKRLPHMHSTCGKEQCIACCKVFRTLTAHAGKSGS